MCSYLNVHFEGQMVNENHASSKKNTSFRILFLSSIEPVIQNFFHYLYSALLHGTVDKGYIYRTFGDIFQWYVHGKSIANEQSLLTWVHFTNMLTPSNWGPHVIKDALQVSAHFSCSVISKKSTATVSANRPPHTMSLYFPMLGDTINLPLCIKPIMKTNMVGFYYCICRIVTTWRNINKKCMVTKHYMTE